MDQPEENVLFREVQDLHSKFILFSVLYPACLLWGLGIYILLFGKPAGIQDVSNLYLFGVWVIFGIGFPILFYCIKYVTEVRQDGIYVRLAPLNPSFKQIPFYMVEECKVQGYEVFTGKDVEVSRPSRGVNLGVILKLISGKKMIISSRKPEELYNAIIQATVKY